MCYTVFHRPVYEVSGLTVAVFDYFTATIPMRGIRMAGMVGMMGREAVLP